MSLLSGFTLLSVLHFLEVGSFGKLDLEKLSFECLFQVAETHSNSHMHLNTFLPFVYAVSMVSAAHIKNAENKDLSHLQFSALMWVGKKLTQNQTMSSYKWIARFDFRLGMPMAWCSWWQKDIFTYSTLKPMTGEAITRHMSFNWFQLILRLLEEDVNLGNFQLSIRQRKVLLKCS